MMKHLSVSIILPIFCYILSIFIAADAKASRAFSCLTEEQFNGNGFKKTPISKKAKISSVAEIIDNFEKRGTDKDYWIIKDHNHDFFIETTRKLISPKNEWLSNTEPPRYVKYCGPLAKDDFAVIEKWLALKPLSFFIITDPDKNVEFNKYELIYDRYLQPLQEGEAINTNLIYKLIWLSNSAAFHHTGDEIPYEWIENHRRYYLQSGHYED